MLCCAWTGLSCYTHRCLLLSCLAVKDAERQSAYVSARTGPRSIGFQSAGKLSFSSLPVVPFALQRAGIQREEEEWQRRDGDADPKHLHENNNPDWEEARTQLPVHIHRLRRLGSEERQGLEVCKAAATQQAF